MPVDTKDPKSLRAAIRRLTRKIRRRRAAIQKLRKWRAKRQRQLKRAIGTPEEKAVKWALDKVGWHEDAGRPNRSAFLDRWVQIYGQSWMTAQPWCGLFVWMAYLRAGIRLDPRVVSTVYIRDAAQRGQGGFEKWVPYSPSVTPQPGWVRIYGSSGPQHTGIDVGGGRIVEGNTSPGNGGSQNDGGGVYVRTAAERNGWTLGWAVVKTP